jgi:hypothetical protein
MKLKIYNVIILLLVISSCSTSKDKFNALNDYLKIEVKDTSKTVIIIKEKISPNYTIEKFSECVLSYYNLGGKFVGDSALYNVKSWKRMKNKYAIKQLKEERFYLKNEFWNKEYFLSKKSTIENIKTITSKKFSDNQEYTKEFNIYAFSEPIYYKKPNIIVIAVNNFTNKIVSYQNSYLVIMEKQKGKWVVLNYVVNEW